jgi:DNA-binding response OmpR family regulator
MLDVSKGRKLLVIESVEDDASLRKVLRDKFTLEGFSVLEATNGEEGLEIALRERPDLILLDIVMSEMDGLTMMKKLRHADEWGKHVPIILLTNLSADNDKIIQAIADSEPAYYIVKSDSSVNDILEKVRERLNRV